MRIAIFGAAGRLGSAITETALRTGNETTAFVRNPSKLTIKNDNLTIIQGDALDYEAVEETIRGKDAVISAMSAAASKKVAANKPLTQGMQNIIQAMKKNNISRLIITAPNSIFQTEDVPDFRFKLLNRIVKYLLPLAYYDSVGSIDIVQNSDVDWTIVRMGRAAYAPSDGMVKVGYLNKSMGIRITRDDAAAFIMHELLERKYIRQVPAICSQKKI